MFGTLHYDRGSKHIEFIDRTEGFLNGDVAVERTACDTCRAKKDQHEAEQQTQQSVLEAVISDAVTPTTTGSSIILTPSTYTSPLFGFPSTVPDSESLDLLFGNDFLPDLLLASSPTQRDALGPSTSPEMLASALLPSVAISSPVCGCLATLVELLEELDTPARPTLDAALASHKLFLKRALRVLHCSSCHSRSEHLVLLTRVCDKLVRLCERIVLSYLQADSSSMTLTSSSPPTPDYFPYPPTESLFLGCYETDASEWGSLVCVILSLQLRSLGSLLAGVRRSASLAQQPRLQQAEAKLRLLVDRLQARVRLIPEDLYVT
ncbi:C6 zinc finger domain containing protein [Lasiodiplodia theobromae]|uniref:C6 zinc finger domain containing protein n=1 Tax=Lasiodiplodia theobromae TaxID=45133 RepID=UPI0015C30776|nr:C6 zinc finger domain containing protein [Lasiodiplodia theobromae]KAF4536462.1 C6 zinc finger domain containing protein [Lasiodiplodia theobromae]